MEFQVHQDDIADYIFEKLVERGYAPTEDESFELADIVFDLLIELGVMEEM